MFNFLKGYSSHRPILNRLCAGILTFIVVPLLIGILLFIIPTVLGALIAWLIGAQDASSVVEAIPVPDPSRTRPFIIIAFISSSLFLGAVLYGLYRVITGAPDLPHIPSPINSTIGLREEVEIPSINNEAAGAQVLDNNGIWQTVYDVLSNMFSGGS